MKFGIIGTSMITEQFMQALGQTDDNQVVVVCSRKLENAQAFAQKYNIDNYVDDYQALLEYDIDAVYIATPNSLHRDQSVYFLKNKVPVLCEKPLAANIDEVEEIIQTAIENKTLVMEAIMPLYTDNFHILRDQLEEIEPVRRAMITMNQYSSRYDAFKEGTILRAFDPEFATGSMMDIGIYPLYDAIGLFGTPTGVFANCIKLNDNIDGSGTIVLVYPDKEVIVSHSKINDTIVKSEIMGEGGNITIDGVSIMNEVILKKRKEEQTIISKPLTHNPMVYEINEFTTSIKEKASEPFSVPYQLTMDVHTILTEAREQCGITFPSDKKSRQ